jgi:hypothetical protein
LAKEKSQKKITTTHTTHEHASAMAKLTEVVSSFRGATLLCQVLASLVAFSALAQRDALTGAAQITGLVVYLTVFAGAVFMVGNVSHQLLSSTIRPTPSLLTLCSAAGCILKGKL